MVPYLKSFYGNPSSTHRLGRASNTAIETAREQVANLVHAEPTQVVFTSGGTEANNLALIGAISQQQTSVLYGATEHPSVVKPLTTLPSKDYDVSVLPVDKNGIIQVTEVNELLKSPVGLISVMHANNESGVIQDMSHLRSQLDFSQTVLHVDAIQSVGKVPVDFNQIGAQLMSLSSHKIYGPKGVGAIIRDLSIELQPMLKGGSQEQSLRPGTENVAAIVGFGMAAKLASEELAPRTTKLSELQGVLEQQLNTIEGVQIVAEHAQRLPNTTQLLIEGMDGEMVLMELDRAGFCISGGSACSSRLHSPSPVLTAMGFNTSQAMSAIRISLGVNNTQDEIHAFIKALKLIIQTHRL